MPTYDISNASYVRVESSFEKNVSTGAFGMPVLHSTYGNNGSFAFRSNAATLRMLAYTAGEKLALLQDGVEVAYISTPGGQTQNNFDFATGLDTTSNHIYRAIFLTTGPFSQEFVSTLTTTGGTLDTAWAPPAIKNVLFIGDSLTQGTYSTGGDPRLGYVYPICVSLGIGVMNQGQDGQKVSGVASQLNLISSLPNIPDAIFIFIGTNDVRDETSQGLFEASYSAVVAACRTKAPNAKITLVGITPRAVDQNGALVPTYNGYVQNVRAAANDSKVLYGDTTGVVLLADLNDGVHFSISTGYPKFKAWMQQKVVEALAAPDVTAPTVTAAINPEGTTLAFTFSEPVTGDGTGFVLSKNGSAIAIELVGSGTTWTVDLETVALLGDVFLFGYDEIIGNFRDTSGQENPLRTVLFGEVVNGSEVEPEGTIAPLTLHGKLFGVSGAGHRIVFQIPHEAGKVVRLGNQIVFGSFKEVVTDESFVGDNAVVTVGWLEDTPCVVTIYYAGGVVEEETDAFVVPAGGGDVGELLVG